MVLYRQRMVVIISEIRYFQSSDLFTMERFNEMIQQINTNYANFEQELNNAIAGSISVPKGAIVVWSGAENNIPANWHLCDGTNGTPDLRDKFVLGAGNNYSVGQTGGSSTASLSVENMPSHTHTITGSTSSDGSHSHDINYDSFGHGNTGTSYGLGSYSGSYGTSTAGEHTHTITATAEATGGGQPHENMPPYYALCYIMRIV